MTSSPVTVSPAFRRLVVKGVLTIILFIFVYLLLFALSIGLTLLCGWIAFIVVSYAASFITIGLSFGLVCMGAMVTYFLLKFIFSRHKADRSHLTEITREQAPQLFGLIEDIVQEVKTDFPKKIYLSADVNAAVFYDSSFWSMFFPISKNLQIGMGLVNSVTRLELKAILAHEFGHFSQRSMKLGSYVYNVNRVIYNMLYENESYNNQLTSLASASGYVAIFMYISVGIVRGIQWILKSIYDLVNVTYMGLSREMEFHADAVAAHVAGSGPLISSLLRMNMADDAFSRVLRFYDHRYQQSVKAANIYPQHRWMMEYISKGNGLPLHTGLPVLTEAHYERYNKSKLVIKDQWASHPGTEERIAALKSLDIHREEDTSEPAIDIFKNADQWEKNISAGVFSHITYPGEVVTEELAPFKAAYLKANPLYLFPEVFNGYYGQWNPGIYPPDEPLPETVVENPATLFSDEMVSLTYSFNILRRDKEVLHQLTLGEHRIKTFDYDGVKYSMDNIYTLTTRLDAIIAENEATLKANDAKVHAYFRHLARQTGQSATWEKEYRTYAQTETQRDKRYDCYIALLEAVRFMEERMQPEQILLRLPALKEAETAFKAQITAMLEEEIYKEILLPEQQELFARYISRNRIYFSNDSYDNEAVELLYDTLNTFMKVVAHGCNHAKLALLESCGQMMMAEVEK